MRTLGRSNAKESGVEELKMGPSGWQGPRGEFGNVATSVKYLHQDCCHQGFWQCQWTGWTQANKPKGYPKPCLRWWFHSSQCCHLGTWRHLNSTHGISAWAGLQSASPWPQCCWHTFVPQNRTPSCDKDLWREVASSQNPRYCKGLWSIIMNHSINNRIYYHPWRGYPHISFW